MLQYVLILYLLGLSFCNIHGQFQDIAWSDLDATTMTPSPAANLTTSFFRTHPASPASPPLRPHIYAISTLEALQSSTHITKLSNTNNIIYIKSSQSSLQYDHKLNYWTLITVKNRNTNSDLPPSLLPSPPPPPPSPPPTPQLHHSWIPITSCLELIHGSGGYLSRYITITIEQTLDQIGEASIGIPPIYFSIGTSLAIGKRVGMSKLNTLLFSCAINPGEVAQFYIRPSFVVVPELKRIWYKFKGKKLHYVGLNVIKSFKMLVVVDTPEHQCWVTRDINDLQCGKTFDKEDRVTVQL